jgi:bifunctional DNase/RNase
MLSSTEAEYFTSSKTAKELVFIHNLLKGIGEGNNVTLPIVLIVDNTGAIYVAKIIQRVHGQTH